MKTNEMTPEWVVINFLPDYKKRFEADFFRTEDDGYPENFVPRERWEIEDCFTWEKYFREAKEEYECSFQAINFPEALSELLKAQREVCAKNAQTQRVVIGHNGAHNKFGFTVDYDSILNAPIPEPKNKQP
jgi:hypothetical protein